ncbi:hypothetical protein [Leptospira sarikeiensis]|uniref:Lipoprotein n=1 Tax=Leptospira sarikeiensis TaxID=2484943 RepID=A0A4R9JXA8_9LEPT|nr:hypothetical protein [Leptospira sarikeiensis]TGL57684.1 hypothetical protein EHQ64_20045 [Leptospira sarikeiensis]
MNHYRFLVLISFVLSLSSCVSTANTLKTEEKKNKVFRNELFGLEVDILDKWVIQSAEQIDSLREKGTDIVAGDDQRKRDQIKASAQSSMNLLTVFQYPIGTVADFNASYTIVAENLAPFPGVKTEAEYLSSVKFILSKAQVVYEFPEPDFKKEILGGKDFYTLNAIVKYGFYEIKQKYYTRISNGFVLSFIISYMHDSQKADLDRMLTSVQFSK